MASTRAHPLNLPDILRITFAYLKCKSLFACAQVNSTWADEAIDILWQTPPVSALVSLVPSGRAQIYANKIRRFTEPYHRPDDIGPLQAFPHLTFPQLKAITCFGADLGRMQWLLQHLQPWLRSFSLDVSFGPDLDDAGLKYEEAIDAVLMRLSNECLHLQEINLGLQGLNKGGLLKFLEAAPSLDSIKLSENDELETDLVQHLATRPNLITLNFQHSISEENVALVAANTTSPFADLQMLRCTSEEAFVTSFATHM